MSHMSTQAQTPRCENCTLKSDLIQTLDGRAYAVQGKAGRAHQTDEARAVLE